MEKGISKIGGLFFIGFMFTGAGIGMLLGNTKIGGALGMGIGFIAMAFISLYYRNK